MAPFIIASMVFIVLAFFVFRVFIKRDYEKLNRLTPLSYALEILIFAIHANLVYFVLPVSWPKIPNLPDNQQVIIISVIIIMFGALILALSWFGLGTSKSLGNNNNVLERTGLYQYSRNPQLLAYGMILVGVALLYYSWMMIVWLLLYFVAVYFMIQSEEESLEKTYGQAYIDYCSSTPRIF